MADAVAGFEISEQNGPGHAIARVATGIAAFIGRSLKGPVDTPVLVRSFAEYVRIFGGLWQPATLGYAVEQYFENGGRTAIIVRVVNGGRPPTLLLPTASGPLRLRGIAPGSREYLRASVDHDGIGENEPDRFNLVLQRIRSPGSESVEEQEIFRGLTCIAGSERHVADVLLDSRLARVSGIVPQDRPARTPAGSSSLLAGYVASNTDGDDGAPLTDYDVIGSAQRGTGLFSLKGAPRFDLLCIPPLTRTDDVGLPALWVAARLCREVHALLVVDPPSAWMSAADALAGLRAWPFRSDQVVMFFPRILATDRLRGRTEMFAPCGAAAGLIARGDLTAPVWGASENEELILRPGLRTACVVEDADRARLSQSGVNTFASVRPRLRPPMSARTLGAGGSGPADLTYLAARRLSLFVLSCIEQGTRWVLFEHDQPAAWARLRGQVEAFLEQLAAEGAFVGRTEEERGFVICDERVNPPSRLAEGRVSFVVGFSLSRPNAYHAFLVTHGKGGSSTRAVSVSRLATSGERVREEIELSIEQTFSGPVDFG